MSESKIKTKQFIYRNSLTWQGQRKGLLSTAGRPDIEIATPAEFKGHAGIWTPEDLFVASINTCIMTTFLHYADKQGVRFLGYESDAEGILEKVGEKFMFSRILIKPKILINSDVEVGKVRNLIEFAKHHCLISNSVKSEIVLGVEVEVKDG